jgi:asparagine synthase (glutamine-hydrolysing)
MPIFGLVRKIDDPRRPLSRSWSRVLPPTFPRDKSRWWADRRGTVALFNATEHRTQSGRMFAFAVTGNRFSAPPSAGGAGTHDEENRISLLLALSSQGIELLAQRYASFACAYWDCTLETLTLARDPFGQQQLYVYETDEVFLFCSELGPLLLAGPPRHEVDMSAACQYLLRGAPPSGHTMAQGVKSVPAAHTLTFERSRSAMASVRYWSPLSARTELPPDRIRRRVLVNALTAAVRSRVSSERNGVLLSGGVDSSLITAIATQLSDSSLSAYTIFFDYGDNKDLGYAAHIARVMRAKHVPVRLEVDEAYRLVEEILCSPAPCAAWTAISHRKLLEAVRANGDHVLLSGMGADETFGGYDRFLDYFFRYYRYARKHGGTEAVDVFEKLLADSKQLPRILFPGIAAFFDQRDLTACLSRPIDELRLSEYDKGFYAECHQLLETAHTFQLMVAHECQHRIPDLLMTTFEPLARAASITVCYPFLDMTLVSLAASLDFADRYWFDKRAWWAKRMLRSLARGITPERVIMRERVAYDVPISHWMRNRRFGPKLVERLADSRIWQIGLLQPTLREYLVGTRSVSRSPQRTSKRWMTRFWVVLTLAAWVDAFVERPALPRQ